MSLLLALLSCGGAPPAPAGPVDAVIVEAQAARSARPSLVGAWPAVSNTRWLLPALRAVAVTVPDQPHEGAGTDDLGRVADDADLRVRTFTVSTTSARLRGPSHGPDDAPLVVALGDGATFGWGVDEPQAWPARLAEGGTVRVLNAGVPGAMVRDLAAWCESEGVALAPAVVIWSALPHPNDPPPFTSYFNSLARCSRATGAKMLVAPPPRSSFDLVRGRSHETARALLETRTLASGHAWLSLYGPMAALPGPRLARRGGDLVLAGSDGVVLAQAPEDGTSLPPALVAALTADPALREPGFLDQRHPDALGHETIAAAVAAVLPPLLAAESP